LFAGLFAAGLPGFAGFAASALLAGLLAAGLAGLAALTGCDPALKLVLGRAPGCDAGLYCAVVNGCVCPTGIAFGDGVIFVTTGWAATAAGGRAEAGAGRDGPLTASCVGSTGFAATTLGFEICSGVTFTAEAATGCPL
jgi:hypothetical protein